MIKFVEDWKPGETNSIFGQLLQDRIQSKAEPTVEGEWRVEENQHEYILWDGKEILASSFGATKTDLERIAALLNRAPSKKEKP